MQVIFASIYMYEALNLKGFKYNYLKVKHSRNIEMQIELMQTNHK